MVMTVEIKADLAREIEKKTGQNAFLCYQCIRCTSGCPLTDFFDYTPNEIMRLVQIGDEGAAQDPLVMCCLSHLHHPLPARA